MFSSLLWVRMVYWLLQYLNILCISLQRKCQLMQAWCSVVVHISLKIRNQRWLWTSVLCSSRWIQQFSSFSSWSVAPFTAFWLIVHTSLTQRASDDRILVSLLSITIQTELRTKRRENFSFHELPYTRKKRIAVSLHLCKDYLTVVTFNLFLLLMKFYTCWYTEHSASMRLHTGKYLDMCCYFQRSIRFH